MVVLAFPNGKDEPTARIMQQFCPMARAYRAAMLAQKPACSGHLPANVRNPVRCVSCGHQANANINAAENIRLQGIEILARAGNPSLGVQPEAIAANKRIKPRRKTDPRCTRELALLRQ